MCAYQGVRNVRFFGKFGVFLSGPLSNKEVIGSTEVNLGGFLRPNIYYKIEMKVISLNSLI